MLPAPCPKPHALQPVEGEAYSTGPSARLHALQPVEGEAYSTGPGSPLHAAACCLLFRALPFNARPPTDN